MNESSNQPDPTRSPTRAPTRSPTLAPTPEPTTTPSVSPSQLPSTTPSLDRSESPSDTPSSSPTNVPTNHPSRAPSSSPSASPSTTAPTLYPTDFPTSSSPTDVPTNHPSRAPSSFPSASPSTTAPTLYPTDLPTGVPTATVKRGPCENSDEFRWKNKPNRDCTTWVARKPEVRCGKVDDITNKPVKFYCPLICKPKCLGACTNDPTFRKRGKDCDAYLHKKRDKRCTKKSPGRKGLLVADSCPEICKKELCKCQDRTAAIPIKYMGKKHKWTCNKIKKKGWCKKKNISKTHKLRNVCPVACLNESKCLNLK